MGAVHDANGSQWFVGAATLALALTSASVVHADPVSPDAKGTVGGALIGAEAVVITEALLGVRPWWAYAAGGALGAGAGATAGYFAEQTGSGELAVGLLVVGMVGVIPGAIAVSYGTAYRPPEDGQSAPLTAAPLRSPALIGVNDQQWMLSIPVLQVRDVHTREEVAIFGAKQAAQFCAPVLHVWF